MDEESIWLLREVGINRSGMTVALLIVSDVLYTLPHGAGVISIEVILNAFLILLLC